MKNVVVLKNPASLTLASANPRLGIKMLDMIIGGSEGLSDTIVSRGRMVALGQATHK